MGVGDVVRWTIKPSDQIDEYIYKLDQMHANTEEMIGRSIFPGAAIVTDAIRAGIESIPEAPKQYARGMKTGLTASQKAGLLDGLGIAVMRNDGGFLNVKVGMDGYNSTVTKRWPKGQPNALIIRALESGTSFQARQPVIAPAIRSSRNAAIQKMKEQFDEETRKVMGL